MSIKTLMRITQLAVLACPLIWPEAALHATLSAILFELWIMQVKE